MNIRHSPVLVLLLSLAGCAAPYKLVPPGSTQVAANSMVVTPTGTWNQIPKSADDTRREESWTRNGPLLDTIAFVGGVPDGEAVAKQKKKDDQQVPVFRSSMSPEDLVSMVETSYRARGVPSFSVTAVTPTPFLGATGIQLDYAYVLADSLPRKGRCVLGVRDEKLYMMKLEGAESHYFDTALPEFSAMVESAAVR